MSLIQFYTILCTKNTKTKRQYDSGFLRKHMPIQIVNPQDRTGVELLMNVFLTFRRTRLLYKKESLSFWFASWINSIRWECWIAEQFRLIAFARTGWINTMLIRRANRAHYYLWMSCQSRSDWAVLLENCSRLAIRKHGLKEMITTWYLGSSTLTE